MDKRNKRIGKLLAALIAFGVLAGSGRTVLPVDAAQDAQTAQETENADDSASYGSGMVMEAEKETAMKAEPETSAETPKPLVIKHSVLMSPCVFSTFILRQTGFA